MNPLDNPAWTALTSHQSPIALVEGMARRFPPEMTVFGALALHLPQAWNSLARLAARAPVGLYSTAPLQPPSGWSIMRHVELFQMLQEAADAPAPESAPDVIDLNESDLPEMSALYEATRPGRKICPRIQKLGGFVGIRCEGQLVAMGGLRLHLPGYREITTVATLPGFEGRGYATAMVAELAKRIRGRNERPFLTVRTENVRAIEIYRRLGFRERTRLHSTTISYGG
jgi:ribosomal protein S18 acetylase RimI-like enzyme